MISLLIHHYSSGSFPLILEILKNFSKRKKVLNKKNLTKNIHPVAWQKKIKMTCLASIYQITRQSIIQKKANKTRKTKLSTIK